MLELIRGLAPIVPQAEFVLLSQAHTHGLYSKLATRRPDFVNRRLAQWAYKLNGLLKHAGDIVFCCRVARICFSDNLLNQLFLIPKKNR